MNQYDIAATLFFFLLVELFVILLDTLPLDIERGHTLYSSNMERWLK